MKPLRSLIVSFLVGCACSLALLPVQAFAKNASAPLGRDFSQIETQAQDESERDAFAPEQGFNLTPQAERPSTFDLRHVVEGGVESCYVTPVRQQNPYGSCWGFGAIAAAESSLLSAGLAHDPSTLNLSEKQVVWFTTMPIPDTTHPQHGEGMTFGYDIRPSERYDTGGLTTYATNLFASGVGPTSEATDTNYGKIFRYSGRKGEVVNDHVTWIDADGAEQKGFKKVYYSEGDDWSMPEAYRFWQDYQLTESYLLPSPALHTSSDDKQVAINAIKDQLLDHHAVAIQFEAQSSRPGQASQFNEILSENWAQYQPDAWPSNHVVTIVGYDDGYPKSNFATEPPADGAWLVKNSWGSDLLDFPDNGYRHWGLLEGMDVPGSDYQASSPQHTGYFWLSYYDATIRDPEAYAFEAGDERVIIDQHDFMPVTDYEQYTTDGPIRTANVFVAAQDEMLTDISFMTATPGTRVSWRVYLLDEDATAPEDGRCVAFDDDLQYPYGGYHRVAIEDAAQVSLAKGQRYAIVVEQRVPSGKYSMTVNTSISYETSYNGSIWFEGVVNEGESFFYVDGAWRDLSDNSVRSVLEDDRVSIDNFSIKGYAQAAEIEPNRHEQPDAPDDDTRAPYLEVRRSTGKLAADFELEQLDTVKFLCTIRGATDDIAMQPTFTWSVSDDSILSITPNAERAGADAVVQALRYGEAYLTVDAGIYGSCTMLVTVPKLSIADADLADEDRETVYTGKPYEPEPIDVCSYTPDYDRNYDIVRGKDYEVSYSDNVLCGRGEVVIRGIGEYGGEIGSDYFRDLSFVIVPAKAQITNVTTANGSITVTFASQKASAISGYELSWKRADATEDDEDQLVAFSEGGARLKRLGPDATSATIQGLTVGASYEINLRAFVTVSEVDKETDEVSEVDHYGETSDIVTCVASESTHEKDEPDPENEDEGTARQPAKTDQRSGTGSSKKAAPSRSGQASPVKKPPLPRTGDVAHPAVPLLVTGFSLVALGVAFRKRSSTRQGL